MKTDSIGYIFGFAGLVCFVCSIFVAGSAVALKDRQKENEVLDRQKQVLKVAGLMRETETLEAAEVTSRFEKSVKLKIIDLKTGVLNTEIDAATFDQTKASKTEAQSVPAPEGNAAKVQRLPKHANVYEVVERGQVTKIILPVVGKGLWGDMYGYLALGTDTTTIEGITFYKHQETPGLGGEVDNANWKALWKGRKAFDEKWVPKVDVIKGVAKPASEDPYNIDGLSGATITSRSVGHLVRFWIGDDAFGPYLKKVREAK